MKTFVIASVLFINSILLIGQTGFEKYNSISSPQPGSYTADKAEPMFNPLMEKYDVKFYGLEIDSINTILFLKANVTILATVAAESLDTFVVELNSDYTVDSVLINGISLPFTFTSNDIKVPLSPALLDQDDFESRIYYHGRKSEGAGGFFNGISYSLSRNIIYTLSEPLYATDWFPCKQVLTDKADSVWVFVTTDSTLKVGSNGLLTNTVYPGNGKARYEWKSKYPIAYYLISMTIGPYLEYNIYAHPEGLNDSILIQNYLYNDGTLEFYKEDIDITADIMEAYCKLFGMYPFKDEKYGHCMAPIGGGMEHQTMTTIDGFDFMVVAHELAHMWFGDYVTCGTWQDIWINEGFGTYCHLLAVEYLEGEFPIYDMNFYHIEQIDLVYDGSIFIPEEYFDIDYSLWQYVSSLSMRIFDWYLSYEKGAVILHMLRYELNDDEMFFHVLRTYLQQYQNSNAIGLDFKNVLETESGKDFTDFFNQWYFGEGYPRYRITWDQNDTLVLIRSLQDKSSSKAPFFRMNMDYQLIYPEGDTIVRFEQTQREEFFEIPFSKQVTEIVVDPDYWVLAQIVSIEHEDLLGFNPLTKLSNVTIYPNPFSNELNIDFYDNKGLASVKIFNALGKCFYNESVQDQSVTIHTDQYKSGIYFLELETASGVWIQKIAKN